MEDKVFDDIFRVVETLEPSTRFLEVEKGNKNLVMSNNFMIVEMPNGKARLLPHMLMINIYRGQTKDWLIQPNILRDNPSKEELIIDNIKIIDYELVLRSHPIVEMAIEETLDIDFESLAQHYGLKTNLVDFTFDIAVAAFFATNRYNSEKKTYEPVGEGIGIIYHDLSIAHNLDGYSPLGVQPFKRPHKQSATSIKVRDWSKYNQMVGKVKFYQNYENSKMINEFFTGINELFPKEDIVGITDEMIGLNKISSQAIDIYSEKNNVDKQSLVEIIKSKGYFITDENIYKLSRQVRRNIKRNLKGSLAEDLGIISSSRLSF
ncbi:MAG: hypothetical protein ACFWUA_08200 [Sporanaerobacter sp.]|uniref:FRG domain-containing protein n=1 Tax=Sporanaerobacter sp. TaxID=2010183 RepID=UPI003A0FD410